MPPALKGPREVAVSFTTNGKNDITMIVEVSNFPVPVVARNIKGCKYDDMIVRVDGRPRLVIQVPAEQIKQIGKIFGAPFVRACYNLYTFYARFSVPPTKAEDNPYELIQQDAKIKAEWLVDNDFITPLVDELNRRLKSSPFL